MTSDAQSQSPILDADKRRVLTRIGKLLELSNDIERNRQDTEFAARDGRLVYVFDENIFEMFIAPRNRRLAISSHYINADPAKTSASEREAWELYETQLTLIAAEFLMSEHLPGIANQPIFVTPWHRVELATRLDRLFESYGSRGRQQVAEVLKEKALKHDLLEGLSSDAMIPDIPDAYLAQDMSRLEGVSNQERWRFRFCRQAAQLVAGSRVLEPLQQLNRLTKAPLEDRLVTLTANLLRAKYGATDADMEQIKADTSNWFFRIQDELRLNQKSREKGSIWSDAQSIAILRWLSSRLDSDKERLAFVTTDAIVFDAYRRWNAALRPDQPGYYDPFFMRSGIQYVPLLNLVSAKSDLVSASESLNKKVSELFYLITEAVEISLLPFNISRLSRSDADTQSGSNQRSRDDLSLRLSQELDSPSLLYFLKSIKEDWYFQRGENIGKIRQAWQEVERIAIGFFYNLLMRRLEDDGAPHKILGKDLPVPFRQANAGQLAEIFLAALGELIDRSERAWLPLARSAIEDFAAVPNDRRRVPYTIWGDLSYERSLSNILRQAKQTGRVVLADRKRPHVAAEDLFMIAAGLAAVSSKDWSSAERYAALAARSSDKASNMRLKLDADFIRALTKRFSLGRIDSAFTRYVSASPQVVGQSLKHAASLYNEGFGILQTLIDAHKEHDGEGWHVLRLMRAHAERAALGLFGFVSFSAAQANGFDLPADLSPKAILAATRRDLDACRAIDQSAASEAALKAVRRTHHLSVRQHYLFNYACFEVERLLFENGPPQIDPSIAALRKDIERTLAAIDKRTTTSRKPSNIVEMEIATFFNLCGDKSANVMALFNRNRARVIEAGLPIDLYLAEKISARFGDSFPTVGLTY